MKGFANLVTLAVALYLLALSATSVLKPGLVKRFLNAFASSARTHYLEQSLRLLAGIALVISAPSMRYQEFFLAFGWIIIVTTAGLLLIPWQWHYRFGQWAIPLATRHMKLFALGAMALGLFVLYGIAPGH